jgi:polar amino acid transport system substrate-binding protein
MNPAMRLRGWFIAAGVGVVTTLALSIWLRGDDSLRRVLASGVLRVGYAAEAPYASVGPDGTVTGESPESALRIAQRLGVARIDWVQVSFVDLIPGLLERRFDVVAAGLFITEERRQRVRFSDPTVRVVPGLLVQRGNPKQLRSALDAVARTDVRAAVLDGSVEQARLAAAGLPAARTLVVPDAQAGRSAVARGTADLLALSLPTLRWMTADLTDTFEAMPDAAAADVPGDLVGFAFHPDDAALQRAWNAAQAGWVGSDDHRRLVQRFGFAAADLVGPRDGERAPR